jgi:hypothetical protein
MCADTRMAIRQVAEMHLNERLEKSREAIGQQLAVGQQKVSSAYNRLWTEMEAMREAQRKRQEEQRALAEKEGRPIDQQGGKCKPHTTKLLSILTSNFANRIISGKSQAPDLSHAQANIQAASKSAGAYFSSWGTWASEKRKGWGNKTPLSSPPPSAGPLSPDMNRAEDFRREKEALVGEGDTKRNSLFFDAEKDKDGVAKDGDGERKI